MLAYVLAAASPGSASMIPARLEGWWLATAVAGLVVAATSPRRPGDRLRSAAAAAAAALAEETVGAASGALDPSLRDGSAAAVGHLDAVFEAAPYRPTGLAASDQALGNLVEVLDWIDKLLVDVVAEPGHLEDLHPANRALLEGAATVLEGVAAVLLGRGPAPELDRLEELRRGAAGALEGAGAGPLSAAAVHGSFHARSLAVAVRTAGADALVAARLARPEAVAEQRLSWLGGSRRPQAGGTGGGGRRPSTAQASLGTLLARHASVRSVGVRNSARGAVAVAAAIAVADLTAVQHGFWVVLGTLSVLRTTATATGGTVLRALLGTAVGFVVGAAVILAVGTDPTVLWLLLPLAVLVAAYTPGVAPFAAGQAAFTAMLVVLYNLLLPVGWRVGATRVEDIALGCGVSLVVGVLVWPRGATSVVTDDLHDAFSSAAGYLVEASEAALGLVARRPETAREALVAGLRLEDALRAFLTEQGPRPIEKEDLWVLVGAAQRLRLTAAALAELPAPPGADPQARALAAEARVLAAFYEGVATHLRHGPPPALSPLGAAPAPAGRGPLGGHARACQLYVDQHLRHLRLHHEEVIGPADRLAAVTGRPWWRPQGPPLPLVPVPPAPLRRQG